MRHRFAASVVILAAAAIVLGIVLLPPSTGHSGKPASSSTSSLPTLPTSTTDRKRPPATTLTSYGVQASWVVEENNKPGTTQWKIPPGATSGISGFASSTYAEQGDDVMLFVSTQAASFHVEAYRMGYYHGTGARLVWESGRVVGHRQPACPVAPTTNMVACDNWRPSLRLAITPAFVEGDYLLKLVGSGREESYVPLTVSDLGSHATYLVKNDVYTWQAWNPYGGYDFYAGVGSCPSDVYPLCSRARVVSFDRPYAYGQGAGDFLGSEYPLVRFMEQHGLDVTYVTDITVEEHPAVLLGHRAMLSLGHDECWSLGERLAADVAERRGVNMIFFGASAILRHVRSQASPLGADREEVDYRDSGADPLYGKGNALQVTGNTWGSPPASWPEMGFVGEQYAGYLDPGTAPVPFVVEAASSWIFKGTGLRDGSRIAGVVATDFDEFDIYDHPADLDILGHSPVPLSEAVSELGDAAGSADSDMTYWTDPKSGAGIFDSGTTHWIPSLASCGPGTAACPAGVVGRITGNLLLLFGRGPAGLRQPSKANWQGLYGS